MADLLVSLGDKTYNWRLRWKDVREIETAISKLRGTPTNWYKFRAEMNSWSVEDYAVVLWAGIRRENPNLTVESILESADWTLQDLLSAHLANELSQAIPAKYLKNLEAPTEKGAK